MKGKIWLKSEVGKGSQFFFTASFGVLEDNQEEKSKIVNVESNDNFEALDGKRILLVDDNKVNLMVAEAILKKWGINVSTAMDGQLAIESLQKSSFDLVLMDIQMPVLDGYSATKKIREELKLKNLPIIALSANVMSEDFEKSMSAGMDAHLGKPIDAEQLLTTISHYI